MGGIPAFSNFSIVFILLLNFFMTQGVFKFQGPMFSDTKCELIAHVVIFLGSIAYQCLFVCF